LPPLKNQLFLGVTAKKFFAVF